MNVNTVFAFNKKLSELFSDGKGEAGLEIGVDADLHYNEYVQIHEQMIKDWYAKIECT
jgi:hypothetical protein